MISRNVDGQIHKTAQYTNAKSTEKMKIEWQDRHTKKRNAKTQ